MLPTTHRASYSEAEVIFPNPHRKLSLFSAASKLVLKYEPVRSSERVRPSEVSARHHMTRFYSDVRNLTDTIWEELPRHEKGSISVVESHAVVDGLTPEEVKRRNITSHLEEICIVSWDYNDLNRRRAILARLQIKFHESKLQSEFAFRSSGGDFTRLQDLSDRLRDVESRIMDEFDVPKFDFHSIDSASMSGGFDDGLADREFTYEQVVEVAKRR